MTSPRRQTIQDFIDNYELFYSRVTEMRAFSFNGTHCSIYGSISPLPERYRNVNVFNNGIKTVVSSARLVLCVEHERTLESYEQPDHLCENKWCSTFSHLEIVTAQENSRRSKGWIEKDGKRYCKRGHLMEGRNLLLKSDGFIKCRECAYLAVKRYNKRR